MCSTKLPKVRRETGATVSSGSRRIEARIIGDLPGRAARPVALPGEERDDHGPGPSVPAVVAARELFPETGATVAPHRPIPRPSALADAAAAWPFGQSPALRAAARLRHT